MSLSCYEKDPQKITEALIQTTNDEDIKSGLIALTNLVSNLMRKKEPITGYATEKVFLASTSHITEEDGEKLNEHTFAINYEAGWLVFIHNNVMLEEDLSEEFKFLIRLSKSMGCDKIRLDRDQIVYNNLPTFDW